MKPTEITVLSGKGGTGKTTFTSLLATKLAGQAVLCDADVDAPDLWILLHPEKGLEEPFFGGDQAVFDLTKCIGCGRCEEVCRFRALEMVDGKPRFEEGLCEGCSACVMVCPADCISLRKAQQGDVFFGPADTGPIRHARPKPGQRTEPEVHRHRRTSLRGLPGHLGPDRQRPGHRRDGTDPFGAP